jgi:predicted nucleic acid-binding protein
LAVNLAIDTNAYTAMAAGDQSMTVVIEGADIVYVPFVVLAELRAGFRAGSRGRRNEQVLQQFLSLPDVNELYPDAQTTRVFADVYSQLRKQGTPIPQNDLWIASLVIQHDLTLLSRDRHFDHLPQIARVG